MQETIEGFRLSPQQRHLWTLRSAASDGTFVSQCVVTIDGSLDRNALRTALTHVAQRHEILRTRFETLPGMKQPLQVISASAQVEVQEAARLAAPEDLDLLLRSQALVCGDLTKAGIVTAAIAQTGQDRHVLVLTLPALCSDDISLYQMIREISDTYSHRSGLSGIEDEPRQYVDLSEWQNELLESEETAGGRSFWKKFDRLAVSSLNLADEQAFRGEAFAVDSRTRTLPAAAQSGLARTAKDWGVSQEAVCLGVWSALLHRLTGAEDLTVAVASSGRKYAELEKALGLFAKHLPVTLHLEAASSVSETARTAAKNLEEAHNWQEYYGEERHDRSSGELGFWPYVLNYRVEIQPVSLAAGWTLSRKPRTTFDRFKLRLVITEQEEQTDARLEFDQAIYTAEAVERWLVSFTTLLESIGADPQVAIGSANLIGANERQRLLKTFNDTTSPFPEDQTIDRLFEAQAKRTPEKIAVRFQDKGLTYAELDRRSNQLANYLKNLGVGPEVMVAISVERSLEMVVGLIGILKAGGAYVPIDPQYPIERLSFMMSDSKAPVLLTQKHLLDRLPKHSGITVCLDTEWPAVASAGDVPPPKASAGNLAYVIYTSGSTGQPKGVLVTHRNLVHSTTARMKYYADPVTSFLLLSPFAFDSSVAGIFWTLCHGGTLFLPQDGQQRDVQQLGELISNHKVSHLLGVPSLYQLLLNEAGPRMLESLKAVIVAGEACPRPLVSRHHELLPGTTLYNEYGPTEVTVWSTVYRCEAGSGRPIVPIGKPIANIKAYVVDSAMGLVPTGAPGELLLGGAGVARGYLNREELTREKFIANPFGDPASPVLYRSGDLVRILADGNIEFLGRLDQQVKIRGYRIELGEIEALLEREPGVREVAVLVREDNPGDKRIVAYLVRQPDSSNASLLDWLGQVDRSLRQRVPEYMLPSALVPMESMPLSPNGKLDRKSLPPPEKVKIKAQVAYVAPRSETERRLADIWSEVLHVDRVGVDDNFFDLGGQSLLVAQATARSREAFQVDLPLRALFDSPTISGLAAVVDSLVKHRGQQDHDRITGIRATTATANVDELSDEEVDSLLSALARQEVKE